METSHKRNKFHQTMQPPTCGRQGDALRRIGNMRSVTLENGIPSTDQRRTPQESLDLLFGVPATDCTPFKGSL